MFDIPVKIRLWSLSTLARLNLPKTILITRHIIFLIWWYKDWYSNHTFVYLLGKFTKSELSGTLSRMFFGAISLNVQNANFPGHLLASADSSVKLIYKLCRYSLVQSLQCAPERYMKYVQSWQKRHQKEVSSVVLLSLILVLNKYMLGGRS